MESRREVLVRYVSAFSVLVLTMAILAGCVMPYRAQQELTVADAQRSIKVGMSGAEVIEALGSPNIVSTDEKGREVWVYDRITTERFYSEGGGAWFFALAGGGGVSGSSSTSQKTLTIIVKFDEDKKVRDLAYHSSSF
jgi:outer membrane protein assembly factor BamE (lipoprotein component of BamABCDE complex)